MVDFSFLPTFSSLVVLCPLKGTTYLKCVSVTMSHRVPSDSCKQKTHKERGGSVVECRTPEREVRGSKPTAAVLCP